MARSWPAPPRGRSTTLIHVIPDIHVGAVNTMRTAKVLVDMAHPLVPTPDVRIQIGDLIDGTQYADATAKTFLDGFPAGAATYAIAGNHDFYDSGTLAVTRSITEWTAFWHFPQQLEVDLGPVRILCVSGDDNNCRVKQSLLDWLDARLAAVAPQPCLIFHHMPLTGTVSPIDATTEFSSNETGFHAVGGDAGSSDTPIRTVLIAHTNAKAWISGHNHPTLDAVDIVKAENLGSGRTIAAINTSAIYYVGRTAQLNDPIYSCWINYNAGGTIDVRFRNHGAGVWDSPASGGRVFTVTPS